MTGPVPGLAFDEVWTARTRAQQFPPETLGVVKHDADGNAYIFVQADGAITAGDVVLVTEAFQADALETTNSAGAIGDRVGVAKATFADDDYGWVQVFGVASAINAATGATANTELNSTATAGRVDDDGTTGAESISGLFITATAADNTAAGILNWPAIKATLA